MAAPILFPDDPNLQTKTVLADNDVFLIGSPADGNLVRRTTLASIKASIESEGSANVYLGTYTTPQDMLASDAEVGQYCYLELDSQKYPVFCVDDDPTVTTSWFAVGGGSVSIALEPPIITSRPFKVARTGVLYTLQITGTNSPINFSATGLPTGLTCNPYTGLISGIPTADEGVYPCTLYASNLAGTGSASISITVSNSYLVEGLGIIDAFCLKKMSATATNCIQVRNGMGELADIGFDANGELDTSALLAHCGYGDGLVTRWYNQGLNKDTNTYLHQSNINYMPHIVMSGSVVTKNGHPAILDTKYASKAYSCYLYPLDPTIKETFTSVDIYAAENTTIANIYNTSSNGLYHITNTGGKWTLTYSERFYVDDTLIASPVVYATNSNLHIIGKITFAAVNSYGVGWGTSSTPPAGAGFRGYSLGLFSFNSNLSEPSYLSFYNELAETYNL